MLARAANWIIAKPLRPLTGGAAGVVLNLIQCSSKSRCSVARRERILALKLAILLQEHSG